MLLRKHEEARSRIGKATVGGGVTIWPEMDNMRLTSNDLIMLVAVATGLLVSVITLHRTLHGKFQNGTLIKNALLVRAWEMPLI